MDLDEPDDPRPQPDSPEPENTPSEADPMESQTGNSNSIAASIFDIKYDQQVSDYCDLVLKSFNKDVLPYHFGVQVCSREDLIANHTSPKNVNNDLAKVVEEKNWNRKKWIFRPLTSNDVVDFPELTERDLKILLEEEEEGSYQLSQTVSYLAELCS
ncbi:hypothetical protein EVAR_29174_1 [Eumeta japonica]|uniref:Uncharacterized protein n=1 Tax=Eumeta variegata TaxID=151549 RepID=A0A4C1VDM0_EUMVA|nr:hypothetical protein EVAR_29174_1 [Eumeta japonica]